MNCENCAKCCGPVPVTQNELEHIKTKWRSLPLRVRNKIQKQKRERDTCILLDTETKQCTVYEERPLICKMYGMYKGLKCEFFPEEATGGRVEGERMVTKNGRPIGILSFTIRYDKL